MNSIVDLLDKESSTDKIRRSLVSGTFVQGVVTEGQNDENKGKVRVEFTAWTDGKNITAWMPVLTPFAGASYGMFRLPRVKDIVLVGFIGEGMKRPFVAGSLYPTDAAFVGEGFEKDVDLFHFKTNSGVDLKISDKPGEERLDIIMPSGATVSIDDKGKTLTFKDDSGKDSIVIGGGKIDITADQEINLTAGGSSVSLSSSGVSMSGGEVSISGDSSVSMESGNTLTVKGGGLTLQGNQSAKLDGGPSTTISGAMVKIN